jgi:hypothetical protein
MQPNEIQLRGRIWGMLENPSTQSGGLGTPKEDKILEWTLFKIYEQMQEINRNITSIVINLNRRPTS